MKSTAICLGMALIISPAWGAVNRRAAMRDKQSDLNAATARRVQIFVTKNGFEPNKITAKKGEPLRLIVTRKTDATCGKEIVIAGAGIRKALPLNQRVMIDFTPSKTGKLRYACGTNMISGLLVVQ